MLKADFHMHIIGDIEDSHFLPLTGEQLIDLAKEKGFDVLAFTCHKTIPYGQDLIQYAEKKGILLIQSCECRLEGKDILVINISPEEVKQLKKIKDLKKLDDSKLIIAPHPFFLKSDCLMTKFIKHRKLFDAVEYSFNYLPFLNLNWPAVFFSKFFNLPLVGTSDFHRVFHLGKTYTLVDADKTVESVIQAVKAGKIKLKTKPLSLKQFWIATRAELTKKSKRSRKLY